MAFEETMLSTSKGVQQIYQVSYCTKIGSTCSYRHPQNLHSRNRSLAPVSPSTSKRSKKVTPVALETWTSIYQGRRVTCMERAVQRRSGFDQGKWLGGQHLDIRGCGGSEGRVWLEDGYVHIEWRGMDEESVRSDHFFQITRARERILGTWNQPRKPQFRREISPRGRSLWYPLCRNLNVKVFKHLSSGQQVSVVPPSLLSLLPLLPSSLSPFGSRPYSASHQVGQCQKFLVYSLLTMKILWPIPEPCGRRRTMLLLRAY